MAAGSSADGADACRSPSSLEASSQTLHAFAAGQPLPPGGCHVLITCLPKTGSTWLTNLFACLPGFRFVELVPAHGRREQELSEWELAKWHPCDYVSARHLCHSAFTEQLIQAFALRVVFLVRNLADSLVSLDDHLFKESLEMPMGYVDAAYLTWDDVRRLDFLIDLVAPWMLRHYVSWCRAGYRPVTYEALSASPEAFFRQLGTQLGLRFGSEAYRNALEKAQGMPSRFNQGGAGRGQARFSAQQAQRLQSLTRYYAEIDFAPLGLG